MDSPWFEEATIERDGSELWVSTSARAIADVEAARFRFEEREGTLVCTGFQYLVEGELTARGLQQIPFGALRDAAVEWAAERSGAKPPEVTSRPGRGRKGLSDLFLAQVADLYTHADKWHQDRPVAWIAETQTVGGIAPPHVVDTVRSWVRKARERGFLTEATQGVASGALTDKARQVLGAYEQENES